MSRKMAIEIAERTVKFKWKHVPPIAFAMEITQKSIDSFSVEVKGIKDVKRLGTLLGKWIVIFKCSWDTDALGFPTTLEVLVDVRRNEGEVFEGEK